jgi:molybdopterin biosynthesis enzyme
MILATRAISSKLSSSARQELEVASERLPRHAVGAAQVAAVGDRDAQVAQRSTGAVIPTGADAVVAVERTRTVDGLVEILTAVAPGDHVRLAGDDIRAGQRVLARGTRLGAAELGCARVAGAGRG